MSPYIHFTDEQKQRAASVDLESLLRHRGEKLIPSGRDKRLASDHSITIRGNEWFDHASREGGQAVSFVQRYYGLSYPEAVQYLLEGKLGDAFQQVSQKSEEQPKPFELPGANRDMRRVFAYLVKHRGIDRDVVSQFAHAQLLYEDVQYHNAVFVGLDAHGMPRHAHKRSTNSTGKVFRINVEGSDPRHSFHHNGNNGSLFVFEAPIDLLSYVSLNQEDWMKNSYVACCGTSSQPVMERLRQSPQLTEVYLCLDNDKAGHVASQRIAEELNANGVKAFRISPELKDWNDDLLFQRVQKQEVNSQCLRLG